MGQYLSRKSAGSPLNFAVRQDNVDMIKSALSSTGNKDDDESALCLASRLGHSRSVSTLLDCYSDIDLDEEDKSGFTPLILAVYGGHIDTVAQLIAGGVDVNKVSSSGATAFDVALIAGKFDIAELLTKSEKFDVRTSARKEMTEEHPLLMFCRRLNISAVRLMLRSGCDITVRDEDGKNCLWHTTLPSRRLRHLPILVQRVRGTGEHQLRSDLFQMLVEAGVKTEPAVLENMKVTLPDLVDLAKKNMKNPASLVQECRATIWRSVRSCDGVVNVAKGVEGLRINYLPSALTDFLLFDKHK